MKAFSLAGSSSLLKGIARSVDLFGTIDGKSIVHQTDAQSLQSDWIAVGEDLKAALHIYEQKKRRSANQV